MVIIMKSAIVGCGGIAGVHGEVLNRSSKTSLAAFADIKKERAEAFAEKYGGKAFNSLEAMIDAEQIDVLHICTPHYLHVPMAKYALERDINVLMEKPPAISHAQMEELKQVKTNAKLGICFQNRYNKDVSKARELILSGKAGAVLGARAFVTWHRNEAYYTQSGWRGALATEGGGVLINQTIHTLDLLCYFLGKPTSVEAHICNHHLKGVIEVEDTAEAYVMFGKVAACFYATTAFCQDSPVLLEIVCENMTLRMESGRLVCSYKDGKSEVVSFETDHCLGKSYWGYGHLMLIEDFYNCLEERKKFPVGIEEVSNTLNLMFGIYESSQKGLVVTL